MQQQFDKRMHCWEVIIQSLQSSQHTTTEALNQPQYEPIEDFTDETIISGDPVLQSTYVSAPSNYITPKLITAYASSNVLFC